MINLIEKINEKYQNKYNYLKLYNVMYDKNLKECTITFLYPYLIDEISAENKNEILDFVKGMLDLEGEVKIKLKKVTLMKDL